MKLALALCLAACEPDAAGGAPSAAPSERGISERAPAYGDSVHNCARGSAPACSGVARACAEFAGTNAAPHRKSWVPVLGSACAGQARPPCEALAELCRCGWAEACAADAGPP